MERRLIYGAATLVGWTANAVICLGQVLIRTAFEWLRWSETL